MGREYTPRDDDYLPATKGDVRRLNNTVYNLIQKVIKLDMQLNPCPLAKNNLMC